MQVLTKSYIQNLLKKNDQAVIRGMLAIYDRQTPKEQCIGVTKEDNGIGFSGCDAEILSSFVLWYKNKGFLSPSQLAIARQKMNKYWKQLLEIAASKGHEVCYTRTK